MATQDVVSTADGQSVIIPKDFYDELMRTQEMLLALEAGGVDNWEGYWYATRHLYSDEDEDGD